jgi:hypothetical protein
MMDTDRSLTTAYTIPTARLTNLGTGSQMHAQLAALLLPHDTFERAEEFIRSGTNEKGLVISIQGPCGSEFLLESLAPSCVFKFDPAARQLMSSPITSPRTWTHFQHSRSMNVGISPTDHEVLSLVYKNECHPPSQEES